MTDDTARWQASPADHPAGRTALSAAVPDAPHPMTAADLMADPARDWAWMDDAVRGSTTAQPATPPTTPPHFDDADILPLDSFAAYQARKASERQQAKMRMQMAGALGALAISVLAFTGSVVALADEGPDNSVSTNVAFNPSDPALWAVLDAADYASAVQLDPTLPNPNASDLVNPNMGSAPAGVGGPVDPSLIGPMAPRTVFRGATAGDSARALQCLTTALYYEAASESDDGMRGVAQVVLNRVRHPSFPGSVCGVVYQGYERTTGCQFSFTCDGSLARLPQAAIWQRAQRIAAEALSGKVFGSVGLATHYHTKSIWPYWGKTLVMTNVIGAHIFHRWRGRWGELPAFRRPYSGREPMIPSWSARQQGVATSGAVTLDPSVQSAINAAQSGNGVQLTPNGLPMLPPAIPGTNVGNGVTSGARGAKPAGDNLPPAPVPIKKGAGAPAPIGTPQGDAPYEAQSGDVREEYRDSGKWIDPQN